MTGMLSSPSPLAEYALRSPMGAGADTRRKGTLGVGEDFDEVMYAQYGEVVKPTMLQVVPGLEGIIRCT